MAMLKEVRVKCPGCQLEFVVDTRTGQVMRTKKLDDEAAEELFDDALGKVKEQHKGSEDRFNQALRSQEDRQSKLDDAFREARDRAAENPDEKPFNPMDLD